MGIIISILKIIIIFGLIVGMHEGAHFFVAKKLHIYVREFSIGFGPKLFSKMKNGTTYSLRAIPFGGFNDLADDPNSERPETDIKDDNTKYFRNARIRERFAIVIAGATINIIFAMVLYFSINLFYENKSLVVDEVGKEYKAYGILLPGDEMTRINGKKLHVRSDLDNYFFTHQVDEVTLSIIRDGKEMDLEVPVSTIQGNGYTRYLLGIAPTIVEKTIKNQCYHSFWGTINFVKKTFLGYGMLITGNMPLESVSGPVGIGETIVSSKGIYEFLYYMSAISLSLGIVNLLPIPGLDGGKVVFLIIEFFRKKKINEDVEMMLTIAGMIFLLLIAFIVTNKDIMSHFIE